MPKIDFWLKAEEAQELRHKARALGVTASAFVRNALRDAMRQKEDRHKETIRAIRALAPTMARAFGYTQKAPPEMVERLSQTLIERWEKDRQ